MPQFVGQHGVDLAGRELGQQRVEEHHPLGGAEAGEIRVGMGAAALRERAKAYLNRKNSSAFSDELSNTRKELDELKAKLTNEAISEQFNKDSINFDPKEADYVDDSFRFVIGSFLNLIDKIYE